MNSWVLIHIIIYINLEINMFAHLCYVNMWV